MKGYFHPTKKKGKEKKRERKKERMLKIANHRSSISEITATIALALTFSKCNNPLPTLSNPNHGPNFHQTNYPFLVLLSESRGSNLPLIIN